MSRRPLRPSSSSRAGAALLAAALLAAALLAASGGCGPRAQEDAPPLLVLGIDGMDPQILSRLLAAGRMPHFETLAASGGFVPLATTMPPQSPVAWSTFITGLDPAGHGILDFIHRDPRTLQPYLSTSRKGPGGQMELLRRGRPFWDLLAERGIPVTIFKVPANFPPEAPRSRSWRLAGCSCFRAFAGMGTPDMLGTYGTFTWYTDGPYIVPAHMEEAGQVLTPGGELEIAGGRIVGLELRDGRAAPEIHGPPSEGGEKRGRFELFVDRGPGGGEGAVELVLAGRRAVLRPGEWSPWLRVDYGRKPLSLARLTGIVRFYLKSIEPHVGLYMTPVNLDPGDPAMPVSVPEAEAARLEAALGPYYTQGMPDDTKALEAEVLDYGEFLAQDELALDERREHLHHELGRLDSGLLFFYVHTLDQVSHMLWRTADPAHPGYRTEFAPYGRAIDSRYEAMDELLGEAMAALGGRGEIVVLSDHGFAPVRALFQPEHLAPRGGLPVAQRRRLDRLGADFGLRPGPERPLPEPAGPGGARGGGTRGAGLEAGRDRGEAPRSQGSRRRPAGRRAGLPGRRGSRGRRRPGPAHRLRAGVPRLRGRGPGPRRGRGPERQPLPLERRPLHGRPHRAGGPGEQPAPAPRGGAPPARPAREHPRPTTASAGRRR